MRLWSIYKNIFPRYLELHGCVILHSAVGVRQYNTYMQFKIPRENILVLRFYFPYLSLLAQPVTIFVYGPVVYGPARYLHYYFR